MIKSLLAIIADIFWLIVRRKKIQDANQVPDAVNQSRKHAASGDDSALAADLSAARDRLRDNQGGANKQ